MIIQDIKDAKLLLEAGTPVITFDLETTGLSPYADRILSFSAIKCQQEDGIFKEIGRKDIFINPEIPIPEAASKINGITYDAIKDCPTESEVIDEIDDFFGKRPFLAGYNSKKFDIRFLEELYKRTGKEILTPSMHIDVLEMAKSMVKSKKYNLQTIAHNLGVDGGLMFHQSMDDVIATFRVFSILINQDIPETNLVRVKVTGANKWIGPSYKLKRIYLQTTPKTTAYYDLFKREWVCQDPLVDKEQLIKDALFLYNVNSTEDFIRQIY